MFFPASLARAYYCQTLFFSFTSFTGGFSSRQNNEAVKVLRNENLHLQSVNYHGVILPGEGVKDFFMHYVCIRARARKATGSE
ncbi:MAG: hypothetical protein D8B56_02495 [Alloprevotella sp.]|nr:MAG: hypothetical protein D8B56_02495 [Alloprevotella sp.]